MTREQLLADRKPPQTQKSFLCQHSDDLSYLRRWDNKMYQALHPAEKIRERLGGSANMTEPFQERLKGMHWKIYEWL
jgi:hypothetical protein